MKIAAQVSRVLAEAGVPRASAYRSFGRERDGFIVVNARDEGEAVVMVTAMYTAGREMCAAAMEAARAAGYEVREPNRNGLGGSYRFEVTKAQVTA